MKIHFRQGIVRYQTDQNSQPTFLQKSSLDANYVDLIVAPDPTIIAFAHHNGDYLFEEARTVARAWGPFYGTTTKYLFWDINVLTGQLTRGFTEFPPIIAGSSPYQPQQDQHWFDTEKVVMRVWNGNSWVEKIRVFAAVYSSSAVIRPFALGTQVGVTNEREVGNILLDSFNQPLRQSDGTFVTSTVSMAVVGVATKRIQVDNEILTLLANEYVPRFSCVQVRHGRTAMLARATDKMSRVTGISTEDMYQGETSIIATGGVIRNDQWAWDPSSINRPIFCGPTGQLTLTPPQTGVLQQVATVADRDSILVRVLPSIMLDHPDSTATPPPAPPPTYPVADFAVIPSTTTATSPFTVQFADTSTNGPITAWAWDFTGDGMIDATTPDPSYTFVTPGTYSVRLTVTNASGSATATKENFITVLPSAVPGSGTNLDVRFIVNGQEDTENIEVKRSEPFSVKIRVRNDGSRTATMVQRVMVVHDLSNQQVTAVAPLPAGISASRGTGYLQIIFSPVPSMVTGSMVDVPTFQLLAPAASGYMKMEAAVSSPEIDLETGDNTRALTIKVKA